MTDDLLRATAMKFIRTANKVGHVTSGSTSPVLGRNIGLGYVPKELSSPGSKIKIKIRNDFVDSEIVKIPFVSKE